MPELRNFAEIKLEFTLKDILGSEIESFLTLDEDEQTHVLEIIMDETLKALRAARQSIEDRNDTGQESIRAFAQLEKDYKYLDEKRIFIQQTTSDYYC
jgi:hypothetical protein